MLKAPLAGYQYLRPKVFGDREPKAEPSHHRNMNRKCVPCSPIFRLSALYSPLLAGRARTRITGTSPGRAVDEWAFTNSAGGIPGNKGPNTSAQSGEAGQFTGAMATQFGSHDGNRALMSGGRFRSERCWRHGEQEQTSRNLLKSFHGQIGGSEWGT